MVIQPRNLKKGRKKTKRKLFKRISPHFQENDFCSRLFENAKGKIAQSGRDSYHPCSIKN